MSETPLYVDHKSFPDQSSLGYFRSNPNWRRHWLWLVVPPLALCLVAATVVSAVGRRFYESGPVASAHHDFESDCASCHTQNLKVLARFFDHEARSTPDTACLKCHASDSNSEYKGTPISAHAPAAAVDPSCASCHREHRGKLLTHVADGHCTACHANLRHKDGLRLSVAKSVSGFVAQKHPELAWPKQTGTIRFDHVLHSETGIMGKGVADSVRMQCQDCHTPTNDGKGFAPIRYASHCADCHPNRVGVSDHVFWRSGPAKSAVLDFMRQPLTHGPPAPAVRDELSRRLDSLVKVLSAGQKPEQEARVRPLPAERTPRRPLPFPETFPEWGRRQHASIEADLFGRADGCRHCHEEKSAWTKKEPPVYHGSNLQTGVALVKRAVPFDHSKHRRIEGKEIDCRVCHALASKSSTIMLPSIADCQKCHKPESEGKGIASGSCVTCHRYHDSRKEHASHR